MGEGTNWFNETNFLLWLELTQLGRILLLVNLYSLSSGVLKHYSIFLCYRVGLLAFHLALVDQPQDALVVSVLASVLYHGEWKEGVKFAKKCADMCANFAPEIKSPSIYDSDEEIAKEVTKLAHLVMGSISALVEDKILTYFLSRYPHFPRSGMVSQTILVYII